ncbi:hypothetical protein BHU62_21380 [Serratia marcescens]|uniref:Nucleotidyltransferase family protein n=1 Tax=Serratia marcescens TaxID=615 RepID=A0A1Q4NUZ3_SERMA|nr:nucleotidyltransferase family protein [Serratia marcescens]OKB64693.1 hypothetical protein BHU62_21380 [Serratia marcescens]
MNTSADIKNMRVARDIIKNYLGNESLDGFDDVVSADLHFLGKHKLIPIWFDIICKNDAIGKLTRQMYYMLSSYVAHIRREQETKLCEMSALHNSFDEHGLHYAVRKGHALTSLYKDPTHRNYNDLDLLIIGADINQYLEILYSHGFVEGIYDHTNQKIINHSRFDLIKYRLSPDHHPHMVKLVDGVPVVVDLAFTSCWHSHSQADEFTLNNADTEMIEGIRCLSGSYLYLDTMFHLYRETRFINSLQGRSPFLLSYLDLILLRKNNPEPTFSEISEHVTLERDISALLSGDTDALLKHQITLADINSTSAFNLFSYMAKSFKKDSKEMIEQFKLASRAQG